MAAWASRRAATATAAWEDGEGVESTVAAAAAWEGDNEVCEL